MSARLEKIAAEREKARQKRDAWDARYKELDRKYTEVENSEIHAMVRNASLNPDQLAMLLRSALEQAPSPAGLDAAMKETNIEKEEKEND